MNTDLLPTLFICLHDWTVAKRTRSFSKTSATQWNCLLPVTYIKNIFNDKKVTKGIHNLSKVNTHTRLLLTWLYLLLTLRCLELWTRILPVVWRLVFLPDMKSLPNWLDIIPSRNNHSRGETPRMSSSVTVNCALLLTPTLPSKAEYLEPYVILPQHMSWAEHRTISVSVN